MRSIRVFILAGILTAMGLGIFLYKHFTLEFPLTPHLTYNSWYVEARVDLTSKRWRDTGQPLLFNLQLPHASNRFVLVDENIVASGFGYDITDADADGNRVAEFSKRKPASRETIFYRAIVYELDSPAVAKKEAPPEPNSPYSKRNRPELEPEQKADPIYVAIDALIDEAKGKSASAETYVREINRLARNPEDDRIQLIRDAAEEKITAPEIAALLLEADDIPTRSAHGLHLARDQRHAELVTWLEVFIKGKWHAIDPETDTFGLRDKYLVWWYGDDALYALSGPVKSSVSVSVRQNTNNALTRAIWKSGELSSALLKFSFYNLPLDTQLVFKVLLMIPIGGLAIAFLRQVVGVKTFGTFMPVLIALAFRETGLIAGLVLFLVVVALGLTVRSYFDHLKLLLVPRLAAVLTVVVIMLSLIAMVTNQAGLTVGLSISLFPIVILTMTIERMSLMWEEYGPRDAIKTCAGSLASAVIAFFFMNSEILGHLIFAFPELLLVVLSLNLLLGRYNSYKLTEYIRFRQLQKSLAELEKSHGNNPAE